MRGIKPVEKMSVSEWADKYRVISAGAAEPGKWKTSRAPYQKAIMDAFTDERIHRVVVKTCSQVGKSDIMNNVIGRYVQLDPCTIMMVQPTIEMAQDFSKSRVVPMIKDTKSITNLFYGERESGKSRDTNQTILSKFFTGGRLVFCGSNSAAGLASRPIRILLCDEVDRFAVSAGQEGDPIDLAAKRMTTYWNYKMGLFSTPTVEGSSRIDIEYKAGTQEEWQHRCRNCGEYHALSYRDMVVEYESEKPVIVKVVRWRCPDCGFEYSEREVKKSEQKYIAKNGEAVKNGIRSFWLNGFSSPWLSWAEIMREWKEAEGLPMREAVVYNTRFGLSYHLAGEYDNEQAFLDRREEYDGEVPAGVLLLTCGVDVQKNRLEYEVVGWGEGEESWGIKRSAVMGEPTDVKTWQKLDAELDKEYYFADGKAIKVTRTFIDSGYSTRSVYEYCSRNIDKQRYPIKGKGGAGLPLLYQCNQVKNQAIPLMILGVDDGKQEIYARLGIKEVGAQYCHFPLDGQMRRGYDSIYFKQLISERRVNRKVGGIIQIGWEPVSEGIRNEALDMRVYNLACIKSCIGHSDPQKFWERRREELKGKDKRERVKARRSKAVDIWNG